MRPTAAVLMCLIATGIAVSTSGCGGNSGDARPDQSAEEQEEAPLKTVQKLIELQRKTVPQYEAKLGDVPVWGDPDIPELIEPDGEVLFSDDFSDLDRWHHEGIGKLALPEPGVMQINCVGGAQGGLGCMAFCQKDFPDNIAVEYEMKALTTRGLLITFIASKGRKGEDMLTELPEREGVFADYVRSPHLRSYHVSITRYNDEGEHTGVSNWRRNPGLFLMAQQPDLCKQPQTWYRVRIVKKGPLLQLGVNGELAGGFRDPDEIPEPLPDNGKVGFRAIGDNVLVQIRNFRVVSLD